jgi:Ca2+-binding EF-hand superfamily protein
MTRHKRLLALATLMGGLGLGGGAFAQQAAPDMPPPPPPGKEAGRGHPMEMPGGLGGPRGARIDFVAIDADGDGALTRDELTARATTRLAAADANGDGALDRAELIAALPGPRNTILMVFAPDPAAERADRFLAFMGVAENGRVEIAAIAERQVNGLVARFDADRDGAISRAEARRPAKGHRSHGMGHGAPGGHGAHGDGRG